MPASREQFVMIGPITDQAAVDIAARVRSSRVTTDPITVVTTQVSDSLPRTRFTAAEINEMLNIVSQCWEHGHGGQAGRPSLSLPQARLTARVYAAVSDLPEPDENALAQARASSRD